jgi:chemotaxis methyl-accepting protein methylase
MQNGSLKISYLRNVIISNRYISTGRENFDVVHVRHLVLGLTTEDRKPFISKLMMMLKPGGYLQWDELDCVSKYQATRRRQE